MVMTGLSCCIGDDRNCPEGDTAARLRQVRPGGHPNFDMVGW
jgi:hypothetical protein